MKRKMIPEQLLRGPEAYDHFVRRVLLRDPFFLCICLFAPISRALTVIKQEFVNLTLAEDVVLLVLRIGLYLALKAWLFPIVLRYFLRRNIPYVYIHHGFFLACAIPSAVALFPLADLTINEALIKFGRQQMFCVLLTILIGLYFSKQIKSHLGTAADYVPVFWPVTIPQMGTADISFLDAKLSGAIVAMQAQNQYVLVHTATGSHLLRMTLGQAIDALPQDIGLRVHRSWWVAKRELPGISFDRKAMVLVKDGLTIPVSRPMKDQISDAVTTARKAVAS